MSGMNVVYCRITPEDFKEEMERISKIEYTEDRHVYADKLMCDVLKQLGYSEGIKVFNNMELWYA